MLYMQIKLYFIFYFTLLVNKTRNNKSSKNSFIQYNDMWKSKTIYQLTLRKIGKFFSNPNDYNHLNKCHSKSTIFIKNNIN